MPITITMPKLSPTMTTGTIAAWHKREGERVEVGDVLLEVATDKATVEHEAIDEGFLRKILVEAGQEAEVNQPIAILTETEDEKIEEVQEKPTPKKEPEKKTEVAIEKKEKKQRVKASPLAKKLAEQRGIDLTTLNGTGPGGRIMKRDLDEGKPSTIQPLSQMRKVIADRLQEAKRSIPHFYVTEIVNVEQLVISKDQIAAAGIKVTYNDMIVHAVALALKDHPVVNSGFDEKKRAIIQCQTIDVAVAVSLEEGLITPIVFNADQKTIKEIGMEVKALVQKAKAGKLQPKEFQGGSFTVSNLGMFGISDFTAIINPPQSAILAIGGILDVPVVKEGKIVPGKQMKLTLSSDHRVIDGVAAAKFLNQVKLLLENPAALMVTS